MNLTIKGGSKFQQELLREAVDVISRKLMPDFFNELDIDIELIPFLYRKEGVKGDMLVMDDDERFPREYELRLDSKMHPQALIRALAHEMVHVKQYGSEELIDRDNKTALWCGTPYSLSERGYWDQPWEIEAYGREVGLLEHFIKVRKYSNKRWNRDLDYIPI